MILECEEVKNLITIEESIDIIEETIKSGKNTIISQPSRMMLHIDEPKNTYQFKGGYSKNIGILGLRIANLEAKNMWYMLLIDTQIPRVLALINESEIFKLRVGATVANIVKYLAKNNSKRIGFIGAGSVARSVYNALEKLNICKEVAVFDVNEAIKKKFIDDFVSKTRFKIISSGTIKETVENSDIILTITKANEPLVKSNWIKRGSLVISLGIGQELDPQLALDADKIIIDDIEQCKSIGDIAYLLNNKYIREEDIYGDIYDILGRTKKGRVDNLETILVVSQGLIAGDIALNTYIYEKAINQNKN